MSDKNQPTSTQEPATQSNAPEKVPAMHKAEPPRSARQRGAGQLTVVLLILSVIALLILLLLMASNAVRADPSIHSIFFVGLLAICTLGSIVLDISLFDRKRSQLPDNEVTKKPAYHPTLRICGVGLITGISATITYLIADVILSLVKVTPVTYEIIYQYILMLGTLTIAMGFTIWGIVRVCQGE